MEAQKTDIPSFKHKIIEEKRISAIDKYPILRDVKVDTKSLPGVPAYWLDYMKGLSERYKYLDTFQDTAKMLLDEIVLFTESHSSGDLTLSQFMAWLWETNCSHYTEVEKFIFDDYISLDRDFKDLLPDEHRMTKELRY